MKKNVASKLIAGALASAMVLSMAACGDDSGNSGGSTSGPSSSTPSSPASSDNNNVDTPPEPSNELEVMHITVALPRDTGNEGVQNGTDETYQKLVESINEYTQMDIEWEWLESATYYDKLAARYAASNVPDVMVVGKDANFISAAQSGLFWDLTDYLDDYDNLKTIPEITRLTASYNGTVYGVPRSRTLARSGLGYRLDWLNNKGLKEPTTLEEFENMLEAFTTGDPDMNGQHDTVGLGLDQWTGAFDIMMLWFGVPDTWGIDANGDLIHYSQTPEYKTALDKFREWYSNGWINDGSNGIPDFMDETLTPGTARNNLLRTGLAGVGIQVLDDLRKVQTYYEEQGLYGQSAEASEAGGEPAFTLQSYVDTGLGGKTKANNGGMNNMIAISKNGNVKTEEQLKRVLQFLNDLNDGECINLIEYGWEGVTYELDADGYVTLWNGEDLTAHGVATVDYRNGFNQIIPYFTAEANARPVDRAPASTPITLLENKLYAEGIPLIVTNYGTGYDSPTLNGDSGQQDSEGNSIPMGTYLGNLLSNSMIQYIKGEITEAALNEALSTWKTAGGDKVTEEMNQLYHAAGN